MPIINSKMFKEGDVTDKDDFRNVLDAIEGTSDTVGLYGSPGDLIHGADQDNFREGGIDRRSLHFDGNRDVTSDDSIVNCETFRCKNNDEIDLKRNSNHYWTYIVDEEVDHIDDPFIRTNYAGIQIPWNAETDQYCIIRCSAYIDTFENTSVTFCGSDMWDLGLFVIPPGRPSDEPLPKRSVVLRAAGEVSPVVWPYQRVMLCDAFSRNFQYEEALTTGWHTEDKGNTFMHGQATRESRFNASFQLNFAARSGKSSTQAGVCPSSGEGSFNQPPIWSSSGTAYVYLVYRNLFPPRDSLQSVCLKNFRLNFTKYRR